MTRLPEYGRFQVLTSPGIRFGCEARGDPPRRDACRRRPALGPRTGDQAGVSGSPRESADEHSEHPDRRHCPRHRGMSEPHACTFRRRLPAPDRSGAGSGTSAKHLSAGGTRLTGQLGPGQVYADTLQCTDGEIVSVGGAIDELLSSTPSDALPDEALIASLAPTNATTAIFSARNTSPSNVGYEIEIVCSKKLKALTPIVASLRWRSAEISSKRRSPRTVYPSESPHDASPPGCTLAA